MIQPRDRYDAALALARENESMRRVIDELREQVARCAKENTRLRDDRRWQVFCAALGGMRDAEVAGE